MRKRNKTAQVLSDPRYRKRVVRNRKRYDRKVEKTTDRRSDRTETPVRSKV